MPKNEAKTVQEHILSGATYFVPSGVVGTALAGLLVYFFNLPEQIAFYFVIVFAWIFNTILIYYRKRQK